MSKNFYLSAEVWGNQILYRGVHDGKTLTRKFPFKPTLYVPCEYETGFKSLLGRHLRPIEFDSISAAKKFVNEHAGMDEYPIYGDIGYDLQFISKMFPGTIEYDFNQIKIVDLDIEVAVVDKFPLPKDADEEINAITFKDRSTGHVYSFGLGPANPKSNTTTYVHCRDEKELLARFIDEFRRVDPHILSGWYLRAFDIPYLVNRIRKVMGEEWAKRLSPFGIIREDTFKMKVGATFREIKSYKIYGLQVMDGMELYMKYVLEPRPDYTLDTIGKVEVGKGKLDYSNYGSLHLLYKSNFPLYIDYNIEDVELVGEIDNARKLIDMAVMQAYDAKMNLEAVLSQTRLWDALIYNRLLQDNICIPPKKENQKDRKFRGAFVKEVTPGSYRWVVSYDFASLYPSIIQQLNISPETLATYLGRDFDIDACIDGKVDITRIREMGYTFSPNGQCYRKDIKGVIPKLLGEKGIVRKNAKNQMLKAEEELEAAKDQLIRDELSAYIAERDCRQKAMKVQSNACYGALGNEFFRYFSLPMAESITLYAQMANQWAQRRVDELLSKLMPDRKGGFVIAMDTILFTSNLTTLLTSMQQAGQRKKR